MSSTKLPTKPIARRVRKISRVSIGFLHCVKSICRTYQCPTSLSHAAPVRNLGHSQSCRASEEDSTHISGRRWKRGVEMELVESSEEGFFVRGCLSRGCPCPSYDTGPVSLAFSPSPYYSLAPNICYRCHTPYVPLIMS